MTTIKDIVRNDLCVGCGLCVSESQTSTMEWNEYGFLTPKLDDSFNDTAIKVCPFNPNPDNAVRDEDKLADIYFKGSTHKDEHIGRFENTYVGYADEYRETSSSGGIATYVFEQLLKQDIVQNIFVVKELNGTYAYQWFKDAEQIKEISKTRYIPVTLEKLFKEIDTIEGKIAVSGVACFIKAIRLKQHYHPQLKGKIPFLVGIICGGLKSSFFSDYLAQKSGIEGEYNKQQYRIKDFNSTASDYSFGAFDKSKKFHQMKMRTVGDMWGTGLFKNNACDFCDDVTTELADVSLGDAWFPPFIKDGAGTNVIVTRCELADILIQDGIKIGKLTIETLSQERFLASQQGSFNHRHTGLSFRIKQAQIKKQYVPPKRFGNERITIDFKIVQKLRMMVRQKSLDIWAEKPDAEYFDEQMKSYLKQLKLATKAYHYRRAIEKRIKK